MKQASAKYFFSALLLGFLVSSAACTEPNPHIGVCLSDKECPGDAICAENGQCTAPDAEDPDDPDDPKDPQDPDDPEDPEDPDTPGDTCTSPIISAAGQANDTAYLEAPPGSTIQLDARVLGLEDATYQWRFVEFPYAQSMPFMAPRIVAHPNGTADFKVESLGLYSVELTVEDADGTPICAGEVAEVLVKTDDQIYVELVWETPSKTDQNDGHAPDLELHYKHPDGIWAGLEPPLDIFWYTPTADWGIPGDPSDDPVMRRFVENGPGPEAIYHTKADPLIYSVGIYSYDDKGYGPSYATVRVYLDGVLADEVVNIEMPRTNHFYEVLTINAGQGTTQYLDNHYEDYLEM